MIITKEHQESWVNAYIKDKHTTDECIGFIDGINKTLESINTATPKMIPVEELEKLVKENTYSDGVDKVVFISELQTLINKYK